MSLLPKTRLLNGALLGYLLLSAAVTGIRAQNAGLDEQVGYFPTYEESGILATDDYDYLRSSGGALSGPDLDRWASTGGIWPYEYEAGGLSRVQRFLQPVDYILRPLTPGETTVVQGPLSESWIQLGASFPFLTRTYHVEKSSFADMFGMEATQYSPFFFDVLAISALAAYVDASGPEYDQSGLSGDSFQSALSVDLRFGMKLTDRTSLVVAGTVYFIFSDDEDVSFYLDGGGLSAFANLMYQVELGSWDISVFDYMLPISTRRLLYYETNTGGGIQQAGNHYIGIPETIDSGDWWNSEGQYMVNTAGFTAGTFIGESLRFLAGFARMDTWRWDNFSIHQGTEYSSAGLFYDGYESWIAPSLTWTMSTQEFRDPQHLVTLNATAPISPNITAYGSLGYSFGDEYEGQYYSFGLNYNQTSRLRHSVTYSSGYHDVLIGQDFLGHRAAYNIGYALGPRITLGGYAESFWGDEQSGDAQVYSASAAFALWNYTNLSFMAGYLNNDSDDETIRSDQWYYNVTLSTQLATRLSAQLTYEYTNSDERQQSLILLRLTRVF